MLASVDSNLRTEALKKKYLLPRLEGPRSPYRPERRSRPEGGGGSRLFNVRLTQLWPPSYPHPPQNPIGYIQEYLALQRVPPPQVCQDHPENKRNNR